MSSKGRKSLCPWVNCDKCQILLAQKDIGDHEKNCPPTEPWKPGFIKSGILYSVLESYKSPEFPKNISSKESNNLIFMPEFALQQCNIPIGDPVLICNKDTVIVKKAWPMNDKISSLNPVFLTKNAMELNRLEGSVKVEKLKSDPLLAHEIVIELVGKNCIENSTSEFTVLIKNYNHNNIFAIGNRICIPHYGKKIVYKIINIKTDTKLVAQLSMMNLSNESKVLYKALYSTKWTILESTEQKEENKLKTHSLGSLGGYSNLIEKMKDELCIGLGTYGNMDKFHNFTSKGILLYGPSGVGKSMISEVLLSEIGVHVVNINARVNSKNNRDAEVVLSNMFEEAFDKAPSIIFIDNIEKLCPKKSNSATEHENKVLETLITLFDSLQVSNKNVIVLALTSKPETIDSSLRRCGRIDTEFEMSVPTKEVRRKILEKLFEKIPCSLSDEDLEQISFETHGFVGADLHGLCAEAVKNAIKNNVHSSVPCTSNDITVTKDDFYKALITVKPSAMKEILVDVPNVKWCDIGGLKDLKLKLIQSVEWPLRHPEAFTRVGIMPPKGVLMFGPPGCSKTMIAKALATESKLNFLNIKGPELFSKWVGDSEKAVRDLFRKAQEVAPSIIFIDELDALGVERSTSANNSGSSVQERVLTQLLTELDGVTTLKNVTLVAATNRPDRIDKALLRPGRFDRLIYVPLPDAETRLEIFKIKLRKTAIHKDVNLKDLVELTEGYSGAEIQAICQEAGLKALEESLEAAQVTKEHFRVALATVVPRTHPDMLKIYEDYIKVKAR